MGVADNHLLCRQAENFGDAVAEGVNALGVRPNFQPPVAEFGEAAGRGHRRVGNERAGVDGADDFAGMRGRCIADQPIVGRSVHEPRGLPMGGGQYAGAFPFRMRQGGDSGALHHRFVRPDEGDEIVQAYRAKIAAGGTSDRGFVERNQLGVARRLSQHAGMQHIRTDDVVDEGRAGDFGDQILPWHRLPNHLVGRRGLR